MDGRHNKLALSRAVVQKAWLVGSLFTVNRSTDNVGKNEFFVSRMYRSIHQLSSK